MNGANYKYINVFYSKDANLEISKRVKDCFDKLNCYTIYLQDIDDIILKKFPKIDFLILDCTTNQLDERSLNLLIKLKNQGYILEIITILNKICPSEYSSLKNLYVNECLENNLSLIVKNISNDVEKNSMVFNSEWVKIIGDYLASLGFCQQNNGFLVLIDSLAYMLSQNNFSVCLGKGLYPYLASKYKVKIYAIEMRIRNAISIASKSKKFPFEKCPTIKQFINYSFTQLYGKVRPTKAVISNF